MLTNIKMKFFYACKNTYLFSSLAFPKFSSFVSFANSKGIDVGTFCHFIDYL